VGISQDYPLETRPSKQPIGEIPGYQIIPSNPLKYPRSKQGLTNYDMKGFLKKSEFHFLPCSCTFVTYITLFGEILPNCLS
jgi:hypothetical protein